MTKRTEKTDVIEAKEEATNVDKDTQARINAPYQYQEFPKMKHHPDGRTQVVNSEREESSLGGEWANSPYEAQSVRSKRDGDEDKAILVESASKRKAAKDSI